MRDSSFGAVDPVEAAVGEKVHAAREVAECRLALAIRYGTYKTAKAKYFGLDFHVKVIKPFKACPSSLGSGFRAVFAQKRSGAVESAEVDIGTEREFSVDNLLVRIHHII